jgi:23S rRNA (cytidine1920-2'-O)/16S rRNA (cytidine1409-2'-O)-methyltransferase
VSRPGEDPPRGEPARLDAELVRRGLARSRGDARDLVAGGLVTVGTAVAAKPSQRVSPDAELAVARTGPVWVSRAAEKLLAAFGLWSGRGLTAEGRRCIDIGASTGGFTQVLLKHGAACVVAIDVGHGQLAPEIATDPRVEDRSGTTVRGLAPADVGGAGDLVVADLSFISLTLVLAELAGLVTDDGDVVTLVKPQFEAGRARLTKHGVVADPAARREVLLAVATAAERAGLFPYAVAASPVRGTEGNTEYLLWLRRDPSGRMGAEAVAEAARTLTTEGPA